MALLDSYHTLSPHTLLEPRSHARCSVWLVSIPIGGKPPMQPGLVVRSSQPLKFGMVAIALGSKPPMQTDAILKVW